MNVKEQSEIRRKRAIAIAIALALLGVSVILFSLNTGSIRISPVNVIKALFGYGSPEETMILYEYRLPRIIVTLLAGAGLGVAGAVFQGVSRNSLADPGILGIHAGAAFGLMIYVSFFRAMEGPVTLMIPLFTLLGGTGIAVIIFLLAYDRYRGLMPIRLILVGIAIEAGFSSLTLLLSLRLDENTYAFAARWLAGNVWGRDWIHVWTLLPWICVFMPLIFYRSRILDLFALGDEIAAGMGSAVNRNRFVLLMFAIALSCASVAMVGGIGFIGLAAPHIARRLVGAQHRYLLPVCAMVGLVILVTADTIGRSFFQPNAIPAGVVVAAIGGPYFLYLLFHKKKTSL